MQERSLPSSLNPAASFQSAPRVPFSLLSNFKVGIRAAPVTTMNPAMTNAVGALKLSTSGVGPMPAFEVRALFAFQFLHFFNLTSRAASLGLFPLNPILRLNLPPILPVANVLSESVRSFHFVLPVVLTGG